MELSRLYDDFILITSNVVEYKKVFSMFLSLFKLIYANIHFQISELL